MAAALLGRVLATAAGSRCFLRCSPTCSVEKWFSKYISSDNRPKQPMSAFIRFYKDQHPVYRKQNPDVSILEITKKIAQVWRELPASDKQPYEAAAKTDRLVYNEQIAKYKASLTPAEEAALKEEKRRRFKKRKATRKRRAEKEAKEAEKSREELGLGEGDDDLTALIQSRHENRKKEMDDFLAQMEAKYGGKSKKGGKKAAPKKGTK
nr:dnaJ homolog subfamily C member 9 isoform X2 [Anolis sagrei ordinatus]